MTDFQCNFKDNFFIRDKRMAFILLQVNRQEPVIRALSLLKY